MSLIKDIELLKSYKVDGCFSTPVLDNTQILYLKNYIKNNKLIDNNTYTLDEIAEFKTEEYHKRNRQTITKVLTPALSKILRDFKIVTANFMIKKADDKSFIPPHQDCALLNEEESEEPTMYCWIPLISTNIFNGTIAAIKGSHKSLNSPSPPLPNPRAPRFLDENSFLLFKLVTMFALKAGEGFFFQNKTFHGSFPNYSKSPRLAIRVGIIPKNSNAINYLLAPNTEASLMFKYKVNESFFDKFDNEKLLELYDKKRTLPFFEKIEDLPYYIEDISFSEFRKRILIKKSIINKIIINKILNGKFKITSFNKILVFFSK